MPVPLHRILVGGCLAFLGVARAASPVYTIAVIPKGTTHEYWRSIDAGAVMAQQELTAQGTPVQIIWKGPLREDDRDQQIQVVENFMTRHVSAIVLAPLDSHALVRPVHNATEAKVPVVIMDSALNSKEYVSFVATDNYKSGQMAGQEMVKLLGGQGKVILLRYEVGSASTEAREAGFLDALKSHPGIQIISSDQHAGATRELAYQTSQNLLNRFGREVNGVFCPPEPTTIAMTKALRDFGLAGGKVKMVGFDSGSQEVVDLRHGDVQALVVQNPMRMGYLAVITAVHYLQGRPIQRRQDTGVTLVTPQNMNDPAVKALLSPPLDKYLKD